MDLRQLTSFAEVARSGTYAAAGRRLHLAQPAVWKHVANLEAALGLALFERAGRRVRLTPAGRLVLERAEAVLAGAASVEELARDLRAGRAGTVTIGCVAPHVLGFLGAAIGAFRKTQRGVRVRLRDVELIAGPRPLDPFGDMLRSGTVDIVTGPAVEGAESFPIYDVHVVCAVPPRHPWRSEAGIAATRLKDVPLLVSPGGYFSRTALEHACRVRGFEPLIETESASPAVLLELGRHGVGVPILASDAVPSTGRPYPVISDESGSLKSTVWLSSRPQKEPAVATFVDLARDLAVAEKE